MTDTSQGWGAWPQPHHRSDPDRQWTTWGSTDLYDLLPPLPGTEPLWDECDDSDFSERMPMRPRLTTRRGEWEDLTDSTGVDMSLLSGWVPADVRAEILAVEEEAARREEVLRRWRIAESQRVRTAKKRRGEALKWGGPRDSYADSPMAAKEREFFASTGREAPAVGPVQRRKTKRVRPTQSTDAIARQETHADRVGARKAEAPRDAKPVFGRKKSKPYKRRKKASFVASEPRVALTAPTCTCGHDAGEHGRLVCMASVNINGTRYVCDCSRFERSPR